MRLRAISMGLLALAAGGCSNPFLTHYDGVECPGVKTAQITIQRPADAQMIGTSDFVTTTAVGNAEAIAAAESIGANQVQWDRAFLRQTTSLQYEPIDEGSGWYGPIIEEVPVTESRNWYRYHARFWRSNDLGGFPPPGSRPARAGTPSAEPQTPPPGLPPEPPAPPPAPEPASAASAPQ